MLEINMNQNLLIKQHIEDIINNIHIYEHGYSSIYKQKLEDEILKSCHSSYSKDNITFFPGSANGLLNIFSMLKSKGYDTCICYSKTFSIVEKVLEEWKKITIKVDLQEDNNIDYILNILLQHSTNKTIVYLPNPNNPTGHRIKSEILYEIIKKYPSNIFIIDEAYSFDTVSKYPSLPNLIITQTLSKIYGLAFLRLGWVISSFKELDLSYQYVIGSYQYTTGYNALISFNINIKELFDKAKNYTKYHLQNFTHYLCDMWFFIYIGDRVNDVINSLKKHDILVKDCSKAYHLYGWIRLSYVHEKDLLKIINIINTNTLSPYEIIFTNDYRKRKCKEILREISNTLTIPWWCTDGTLLGVRRFSDIIPWDDDIDIGIFKDQEELFLAHTFNVRIRKNRTGVYYQADFGKDDEQLQPEHVDIFLYHLEKDRYINTDTRFIENNDQNKCFNMTYLSEELLPLQHDFLDDIKILVPAIINKMNIEKVNNIKYEYNDKIIHKPLFLEYCKYGLYKDEFINVTNKILAFLDNVQPQHNKSIIFDFDDTVFSNARWFSSNKYLFDNIEEYNNIYKDDLAPINPNMIKILNKCKQLNITTICVTGRYEYQKELTEKNMKMFNITFDEIYYRPENKFSCVCKYKQSFNFDNVLCSIGDQPSDIIKYKTYFLLPRCHISECVHHDKFIL